MDGTVNTRSGGFSSDDKGPRPRTGAALTTISCDVTRGAGGEPRQQILPRGGGFSGLLLSPLPFYDKTNRESLSRGHREI